MNDSTTPFTITSLTPAINYFFGMHYLTLEDMKDMTEGYRTFEIE